VGARPARAFAGPSGYDRRVGLYRARDLLLPPSLMSMARVPLAVAFPFVLDRPIVASAVLLSAGASDVLDGWWARRFGQATPTGAVVDPVTDKAFVLTVVASLVGAGHLSVWDVVLLSTRELGELPLVLWVAFSRRARRSRSAEAKANALGKAATTLQFATVACALWRAPITPTLVLITALAGIVAAVGYWARALSTPKHGTPHAPTDPNP